VSDDTDDPDSLMRLVAAAPPAQLPRAIERSERFEIVRQLGAGGMGIVYEAIDRQRGARVALKTLKNLDGGSLFRFKREYRSLQGLQHPNLVSLGDLVEEAGAWFFTMDLVRGVDFLRHVRGDLSPAEIESTVSVSPSTPPVRNRTATTRFDEARLRAALRQLAEGLQFLHAAGKVHRDLKPSNVLVDETGRIVILDLGLVYDVLEERASTDDHIVGTVAYMSPEQAEAKRVGPASDWYSVGVMLYEALTGHLPHTGTAIQVLQNKRHVEVTPPSRLAADLPSDLDLLCHQLLHIEPASRPPGDEIVRRLGATPPRTARPLASRTGEAAPFVGRTRELELLREALAQVDGSAQTVLIQGDSGFGKSALVRHFVETLPRDTLVLAGRCYERESVPYRAVDGVVDALSRHLARLPGDEVAALLPRMISLATQLFPVLLRVEAIARVPRPQVHGDSHELRRRAFEALRELLARIGDRGRLVVIIDDLQWADADSLRLLDVILHEPEAPSMLFVGMGRTVLSENAWAKRARCVEIGPLPQDEARDLATLLLARLALESRVDPSAVAEASAGHPLFIDTLIRHASSEAAPSQLKLDDALWSEVVGLPDGPKRLIEVLCVAGVPLPARLALHAAGADADASAGAVARLRMAHLLRVTASEALEAYHDRVRETVLAHLTPEALRHHNERLATTLMAEPDAPAEALAFYWRGAGDRARASEFAERAAEQAFTVLAFDRAVDFYRMVLELSPPEGGHMLALRRRLSDSLTYAGRGAEAAREYLAAAPLASLEERLVLERRAAEELLSSGHIDEGLSIAGRVLAAVRMKLPNTTGQVLRAFVLERTRLRLRGLKFRERSVEQVPPETLRRIDVGWAIVRGMTYVDPPRLSSVQARNLAETLDAGEPSRIARSLAMEADFVGIAGEAARQRVQALQEIARPIADRVGDPTIDGLLTMSAGMLEFFCGNWRKSVDVFDQAAAHLRDRCQGVAVEVDTCRSYGLLCLFFLGELAEMTRREAAFRQDAELRGDRYQVTTLRTLITPLINLASGQPQVARDQATHAIQEWSRHGFFLEHFFELMALDYVDLYEGRPRDAWDRTLERWPALKSSLLFQVQIIKIRMNHMRGCAALAMLCDRNCPSSEKSRLQREVRAACTTLLRTKAHWAEALAGLLRAGLASSTGDSDGALAHLERSIGQLDALDMALYAACARRNRGRLLGGDAGAAEITAQDQWMRSQGIVQPASMAAMLVPG
jgi:hypothetical protein